MQSNTRSLEREAWHRLPELLGDLLDEELGPLDLRNEADGGADLVAEVGGRRWIFEVKAASRPGVVAAAAEQLDGIGDADDIRVLVVPFMTPAGAKAAADRSLNWLDLSGNARLRTRDRLLYVHVEGRANQFLSRGRPSSPFAPKSSRIAHALLLEPARWWRQKELSEFTDIDDGHVSRIVRRLGADELLDRDASRLRPRDPGLLLDAWSEDYRIDRHDIILGHATGSGIELARDLHVRLGKAGIAHAFTGLPAAWALNRFSRFRLNTLYVYGDPREAAEQIGLRRNERGANVQVVAPDDRGVFLGQRDVDDIPCVSPVQVYLDLMHLPERANDAALQLRNDGLLWHAAH